MSVRRTAVRLGGVLACAIGAAGLGLAQPAPDAAAAPRCCLVTIGGLPGSFQAGGASGELTTAVVKWTGDDCVQVLRRAVLVQLRGLAAGQIRVERRVTGGGWAPVPVSVAGGTVRAEDRLPDPEQACRRGDMTSARYRLAFLAGAPAGQARFTAEAYSGNGLIGRAAATRPVTGGAAAAPPPVPPARRRPAPAPAQPGSPPEDPASPASPSWTPSPAASSTADGLAGGPADEPAPSAFGAAAQPLRPAGGDGLSGLSVLVIVAGLGLVAAGLVLLLALGRGLRRGRHRGGRDDFDPPPGSDPHPTVVLPTLSG